jgi:hypothetical protein
MFCSCCYFFDPGQHFVKILYIKNFYTLCCFDNDEQVEFDFIIDVPQNISLLNQQECLKHLLFLISGVYTSCFDLQVINLLILNSHIFQYQFYIENEKLFINKRDEIIDVQKSFNDFIKYLNSNKSCYSSFNLES